MTSLRTPAPATLPSSLNVHLDTREESYDLVTEEAETALFTGVSAQYIMDYCGIRAPLRGSLEG